MVELNSPFARFPPELVRQILLHIASESNTKAKALCTVSSQIDAWIRPLLYRSAIIKADRHLHTFARALTENPGLGSLVHDLFLYSIFWGSGANENDVIRILEACSSLRILYLGPLEAEYIAYVSSLSLRELTVVWDSAIPQGSFQQPAYGTLRKLHVLVREGSDEVERVLDEALPQMASLTDLRLQGEGATLVVNAPPASMAERWPRAIQESPAPGAGPGTGDEGTVDGGARGDGYENEASLARGGDGQQRRFSDGNGDLDPEFQDEEEHERMLDMLSGPIVARSIVDPGQSSERESSSEMLAPTELSSALLSQISGNEPTQSPALRRAICRSLKRTLSPRYPEPKDEVEANLFTITPEYSTEARLREFQDRTAGGGQGVWAGDGSIEVPNWTAILRKQWDLSKRASLEHDKDRVFTELMLRLPCKIA